MLVLYKYNGCFWLQTVGPLYQGFFLESSKDMLQLPAACPVFPFQLDIKVHLRFSGCL